MNATIPKVENTSPYDRHKSTIFAAGIAPCCQGSAIGIPKARALEIHEETQRFLKFGLKSIWHFHQK